MPALRRILVAAGVAGATSAAALACLDLTPYVYEAARTKDAVAPPQTDAGPDADVDNRPPCIRCVQSPDDAAVPGCASEIAACQQNTECAATYVCALANDCLNQPSFRDIINCGLPCAEEAGIMSENDPAVTLIYDFATCAQANCDVPCGIGDASLP